MAARCGTRNGAKKHIKEGTPQCVSCRAATAQTAKRYRLKRARNGGREVRLPDGKRMWVGGELLTDATATRRRLQSLAALGHSWPDIAKRFGVTPEAIQAMAKYRKSVYHTTAEKVEKLYDELYWQIPPMDAAHKRVRTVARSNGYLPPQAWDEDTIHDPAALPVGLSYSKLRDWVKKFGTDEQKEAWEAWLAQART